MNAITKFLDDYLIRTGRTGIDPVEANKLLEKAGILKDSLDRPGLPLRKKLRNGEFPHAFQSGGKGSSWTIPISSKSKVHNSNYPITSQLQEKKKLSNMTIQTNDISQLRNQIEKARLKYKPEKIKYLLIAEAAPDGIERFFYYENVRQHDYLFLGVVEALYPKMKEHFLSSGRNSEIKHKILKKFQQDGFYLLDLSDVPISFLQTDLASQLPNLTKKIDSVANEDTKIILIKANVYDITFHYLNQRFKNVIDQRITFPGQGGQRKFQVEFKQALRKCGYFD